jgi:hypothetical protein
MRIRTRLDHTVLTALARVARGMARQGERLQQLAIALENALDRLIARRGYAVEDVYAPLMLPRD